MKRFIIILVAQVILLNHISGQNIVQIEYFVDNDPGLGLGDQLTVNPEVTQDIEFFIDIDDPVASWFPLTEGKHILTVRAKDELNQWSILESRVFFVNSNAGPDIFPPAANIVQIEYFIDNDPGLGLGDQLTVIPEDTQDMEFFIDIDDPLASWFPLAEGKHILTVRAKDEFNQWSILESRIFFINSNAGPDVFPPVANIDVLEYFIDTDPGVGNRTAVPGFTPGFPEPDVTFDVASIGTPGIHSLVLLAQDENGSWSVYETRVYHVVNISGGEIFPPTDVIEVEFFIDDDPGVEIATNVAGVSQALTIDVTDVITVPLTEGKHVLTVRAKNINNEWGIYETRPFWVKAGTGIPDSDPGAVQVTKLEYFFNDPDPGLDVANEYPITPDYIIDLTADPGVDFPTPPDIPVGTNSVTVRAKNALGNWGFSEMREFDVIDDCVQPVADFSFQLACAGESMLFSDLSTSIQPDASYNWYLDGDGSIDNTTIGDVLFTYQNPGDYNVTLEIYQGQICFNSKTVNITIKPKPVALFTPQGFEEGSITTFDVVSSNVDLGATWEWDFENDAVVDDNTAGNTSYTYPSAAVYTANLRITDNLGCETSYSSNFNIQSAGVGGGSPSSDFIVSAECEGSITTFTDLSENIPVGAIYSWDFDNDGVEDDNSTGATLFSYANPGDYTAELSIDLGGGNILSTLQPVRVTKVPSVDFSVVPVCVGEVVNFTDLSANLESGVIYSWDFENDGVVDDNTSGDIIHTYSNAGTYLVTLGLDNGNGCIVQTTKQVEIDPLPVSEFTYSGNCIGTSVAFTSISQNVVSGTRIEWDFDNDGIIDTTGISNPTFLFPSAGDYDVSLSLTQPNGCSDAFIETLTIVETPIPNFSFSSSCLSNEWSFTDASQNLSGSVAYSWDFDGDGLEDSNLVGDVTFQYSAPGTYIAILTVDNGFGCTVSFEQIVEVLNDPVPDFTIVGGCVGEEIFILEKSSAVSPNASYSWDFDGDGIEDSQSSGDVSFIFDSLGDYTFNLSIDNGNGCVASKSQDITLHGIPAPVFEVLSDCFGLPSRFVDYSTDVSSEAVYSWDFDGDGISDDTTKGEAEFTYAEFKPYIATLTIDNGLGCTNVAEVIVDFRDAAAPDFIVGPSCINVETVFTDQSSDLETAAIYSWDFNGDGLEDSNVPGSTFYTYTQSGIYQASLTIFNAELCSSTRTVQVEVTLPPDIDLGADVELCTEGTVTIDAGSGYTSFFWDDGSIDQTRTVDSFGEYWVSITDVKGCRNIDTVSVKLKELPTAAFEYNVIYSPIDGIIVDFNNTSQNADGWAWDFGDGQVSDEESPSNTYIDFSFFEDTPYTVCLTATDRCSLISTYCEDILLSPLWVEGSEVQNIRVFPNPGQGLFSIAFEEFDISKLTVVDQKGVIVKRQEVGISTGDIQVDLEGYAPGIYLFILTSDDRQVLRKVILEEK